MPNAPCGIDPMSFEAPDASALQAAYDNQALYRGALLHILDYCRQERLASEVESSVGALPSMKCAPRSPMSLVESLVRAGGIAAEIIADGIRMTEQAYCASLEQTTEQNSGLAADQSAVRLLSTTSVGLAFLASHGPMERIERLFATHPCHVRVFQDTVAFCEEPRMFADVRSHIQKLGHAIAPNGKGDPVTSPSFVLENLQMAGAIVWEGGWVATEAGRRAAVLYHEIGKGFGESQRNDK